MHHLKYSLFIFFSLLMLCTSCGKDDPDAIAEKDRKKILEYLAEHELDYYEIEHGVFVVIYHEGTGGQPHENSTVRMNYEGFLLDGTLFDAGHNALLYLGATVRGFRIGVMEFKRGGKGLILIPSAQGYGEYPPPGNIPRNAVLIFDVEIIDF